MSAATALQKGLFDALTGSAALAAAMGGSVRAYDRVPGPPIGPVYPYLAIADAQVLDDGNTCDDDLFEVFVDIHVWSRVVGQVEAKNIAGAARVALKDGFSVPGYDLTSVTIQSVRHFMDPDGTTAHGVVTGRFLLQTA